MGAFDWLNKIFDFIWSFFPTIWIVRATHGGVKFKRGKKVVEVKPGWHIYWPLFTEIEEFPVARTTQDLPSQVLLTEDHRSILVRGVVIYKVRNIVRALSQNYDIEDTIRDVAQTAIVEGVAGNDLEYLSENLVGDPGEVGALETEITTACRRRLSPFGIEVVRCALTNLSLCQVIRNVGGDGVLVAPGAEEEDAD